MARKWNSKTGGWQNEENEELEGELVLGPDGGAGTSSIDEQLDPSASLADVIAAYVRADAASDTRRDVIKPSNASCSILHLHHSHESKEMSTSSVSQDHEASEFAQLAQEVMAVVEERSRKPTCISDGHAGIHLQSCQSR